MTVISREVSLRGWGKGRDSVIKQEDVVGKEAGWIAPGMVATLRAETPLKV